MELNAYQKRTWAEIDLDALKHNFFEAKRRAKAGVRICCVIKANAYGHGALKLAELYANLGADAFAVSNIEEAIELRAGGVTLPILILGYTAPDCAELLSKNGIEQCVYSLEYAKALSACATAAGVTVRAHIKIDTGMGRLGFLCRSDKCELEEALAACRLPAILPIGIFAHFAHSDGGDVGEEFTRGQAENFSRAVDFLESNGISFEVKHASNSAAIFDYPEYGFNMVRAGISLYGEPPSRVLRNPPDLRTTMTLRSVIVNLKTLYPGESVGYGRTFVAEKEMRVATVPIGYADGFFRSASGGRVALTVCGKPAPILGRVCMDQTMIDVSGIDGAEIGTPVSIFGKDALMSATDMADALGTISYEIFTSVARRVPRVYVENGEINGIVDYLI